MGREEGQWSILKWLMATARNLTSSVKRANTHEGWWGNNWQDPGPYLTLRHQSNRKRSRQGGGGGALINFEMMHGHSKIFNLVSQKSQHPQRMLMQQLTRPRSLFNAAPQIKSQKVTPGWGRRRTDQFWNDWWPQQEIKLCQSKETTPTKNDDAAIDKT